MSNALQAGRDLLANVNPGLEQALAGKYDAILPGMAESLVEWAYGRHYAREGLDMKTRQLCTVAALTVLGGQTGPQLKVNIAHTLETGATEREILEVIWQMAVYGGMPAAINGLNAAQEVFATQTDD
ncbi:carboxymuconolactone decarboxylase family protein [Thalassovita sp.]|uniref:carboxymuconolactone decarboxylase family protein n=1 Tax=Thalassovita sp. TaxID=1979401 RepID=UPI002880F3B4|nr:carboxymuconolactone decarboxylase family protein [Thalassovita sp.]MDF1802781.1 carboxymuconolactone decarboxylase family protein [Thalassovita sp.]